MAVASPSCTARGVSGDVFALDDPAAPGDRTWSSEVFKARWSGFAVVVQSD